MSIQSFIAERVFRPRAQTNRILVVYDPAGIYVEIVRGMARDDCKVVMADGPLVDIRTTVVGLLSGLATRPSQHAVIWLPFSPPRLLTTAGNAQLQNDLATVAVILGSGTVFPSGADDTLQAICLRAFPEAHARIHELFRDGRMPTFALINQLQQSQQWPELQAALGGRANEPLSSREIIEELLTSENLETKLPPRGAWIEELRRMLENAMGLTTLPTMQRASEFSAFVWRTILFSEFVFDASDDLPPVLTTVPRATPAAKELIFSLCEGLRGKASLQELYIRYANEVEAQLQLTSRVATMRSLGRRDTFAFEEKLFLNRFCQALTAGDLTLATEIVELRLKSMWVVLQSEGGARLAEWQAARAALELLKLCMDFVEPPRRLAELASAYQTNYYRLDRAHRLLEEALGQRTDEHDGLDSVAEHVRTKYLECADRLHKAHLHAIEVEGWPAGGSVLENSQLFDTVVEPLLRQGKRVAYLLIDSLRYELAVDLQTGLLRNYPVQLHLSYAQLPTYTEVGMASLMPQAKTKLSLKVKEQGGTRKLAAFLGERAVSDPTTRFNYLREIMGDHCQQERIDRFAQATRPHVDPRTRLYVVRGSDIDEASHAGESRAMQQIPAMMREINIAIAKLVRMGFDYAVIATDHGFMLRPQHAAGDACPSPSGEWLIEKTRCFLGTGGSSSDPANFVINRTRLGIEGEFNQYVTPRALLAYDGKTGYFHEGLSPQENFLPCLVVTMQGSTTENSGTPPAVCLNYRGRTKVTTARPIIALEWEREDLITPRESNFLIQAVNAAGEEVATIGLDDNVDPTIQRVTLPPGQVTRFTLILKDGFTGVFTIKVLDPASLVEYCSLTLETNFTY